MRLDTRVTGAAVGASVVYLFDRDHGQDRRARLSSGLTSLLTARSSLLDRVTAPIRQRRLNWFQPAVGGGQEGWDFPITTVTIDVDDRVALRGMFRETRTEHLPLRSVPAHRGFTRSLRYLTPPGGLRST